MAALDRAHVALLVLEPSVPALKSALRSLERLRRRGVAQGKIKLVMNRHAKTTLRPDAVEKALGLRVSWRLPADFARALEALNQGRPVVESDARSDLARGHRELAAGVAAALGRPLRPQALKTRLLQRWQPLSIAGWQEH